jgi:hypothetical protein
MTHPMTEIQRVMTTVKQRGIKSNNQESNIADIIAGKSAHWMWERNLGIVMSACKAWMGTMDSAEVISLSYLAMLNTIRLFDVKAGGKFSVYFRRCINNECNWHLDKASMIHIPINQAANGVKVNISRPDVATNHEGTEIDSAWDVLDGCTVEQPTDDIQHIIDILNASSVDQNMQDFFLAEGGISYYIAGKRDGLSTEDYRKKVNAKRDQIRNMMKKII